MPLITPANVTESASIKGTERHEVGDITSPVRVMALPAVPPNVADLVSRTPESANGPCIAGGDASKLLVPVRIVVPVPVIQVKLPVLLIAPANCH